jgi:drug/metabolite transporter (DMT)-like permease
MSMSPFPAPHAGRRTNGSAFQITATMAVGLLLLAALCWGAGNVANKTLLDHVGPFTALVARCLLGLAIILPLCRLDGDEPLDRGWLASALGVSVLFAAAIMAQQVAYRWTTVTNVSFLVNTCTVMTAVLAWILLRQRPGWRVGLAGGVTLAGAYLMSGASVVGVSMNPGDLACLVSAFFYAGWMVALGQHATRFGRPMATSAVQFGLTAALMLPLALIFEAPTTAGVTAAWRELLFLGIFSTAAACALVTVAQRHVRLQSRPYSCRWKASSEPWEPTSSLASKPPWWGSSGRL